MAEIRSISNLSMKASILLSELTFSFSISHFHFISSYHFGTSFVEANIQLHAQLMQIICTQRIQRKATNFIKKNTIARDRQIVYKIQDLNLKDIGEK